MRNQVQAGVNLTIATPYDVLSGGGVLLNSLFGVAAEEAASGTTVDIVTEGVFTLPKLTTDAFAVGARVYWDDVNRRVTATAAGNTLIGVATAMAINPSPTVNVRLNGSF
jgi:predicted RecA/RadA family phage recombinase